MRIPSVIYVFVNSRRELLALLDLLGTPRKILGNDAELFPEYLCVNFRRNSSLQHRIIRAEPVPSAAPNHLKNANKENKQ